MKGADKKQEAIAASADVEQLHHAPVQETEQAPVQETEQAPVQEPVRLVVLAYQGTEQLLKEIWKRNCNEPARIITDNFENFIDALGAIVADTAVAEDFVLVQANCIPCAPIRFAELQQAFVLIDSAKREHYLHRLPISFNKAILADCLGEEMDPEGFVRSYVLSNATRPVQASLQFGNIVSPVLRGDPCEHLVIEALLRKKFIVTSPDGWTAIAPLLQKTLLK